MEGPKKIVKVEGGGPKIPKKDEGGKPVAPIKDDGINMKDGDEDEEEDLSIEDETKEGFEKSKMKREKMFFKRLNRTCSIMTDVVCDR